MKRFGSTLWLAAWLSVLVPASAWATPAIEGEELVTEEAHGGGIEWITPIIGHEGKTGLVWLLINFAVLMFLLERLLFRKLRAQTRERHDDVKSELAKATQARSEAEGVMREYRQRMEKLDDELAQLQADAKRKAEADREAIIADAEREAERILAAATSAAEREAESRRRAIENEIVDRAVERAETILREKLTPTDQKRMLDDYVTRLAGVDFSGRRKGASA